MQFEKPINQPVLTTEEEARIDKLKQLSLYHRKIVDNFESIARGLGLDYEFDEVVDRVRELEEGNEDHRFLDLSVRKDGQDMYLRLVGQDEEDFNPDREKDYLGWDLTPQEEAQRWLKREILVNAKLDKFSGGSEFNADTLISAEKDGANKMYMLKKREEEREIESYGREEGRAVAAALLGMQEKLDATGMVQEIMAEEGIKNKTELEQRIFEDYFDNFDGYVENTEDILGDLDDSIKDDIKKVIANYRTTIEARQMKGDEFALVHGASGFDNIVHTPDGRVKLSDWQLTGTSQNKELALVYDLGSTMAEAVERLEDEEEIKEFLSGIEEEVTKNYDAQTAQAVLHLAKLRSWAMILNDLDGDKKAFVKAELEKIVKGNK